jgi:hypothetical protein
MDDGDVETLENAQQGLQNEKEKEEKKKVSRVCRAGLQAGTTYLADAGQ